jgi:hypothetical protein
MDEGFTTKQVGHLVPVPLRLRGQECRKPCFESGSEIVGECMRLRQASANLWGSMTAEAKYSNQ